MNGRDNCERLCVEWSEAVTDPAAPTHPRFEAVSRKATELGEPYGISGGGLWRIRGTKEKAKIWTPANGDQGTLLGVASAWNGRDTEFVEPTSLWADWFIDVLAEV